MRPTNSHFPTGRKGAKIVDRRQHALNVIASRGLTIEPFGLGWRVHGLGLDILCADPAYLLDLELNPGLHVSYFVPVPGQLAGASVRRLE